MDYYNNVLYTFFQTPLLRSTGGAGYGRAAPLCGRSGCGRAALLGLQMQQKKTETMTREQRMQTNVSSFSVL
jgi:hypothetical protein